MNAKHFVACWVAACLLAPVVALAAPADSDKSRPIEWVKGSAISAAVKERLVEGQISSMPTVRVETDMNGIVWLSGTVRSRAEADRAVEIARTTDGVTRVRNDLVVRPDSR
jgi:hyperosmotically inducible protein